MNNECIIKFAPGTRKGATKMWHLFGPDGTHMEYTVKAWAEMYAQTHGWTIVKEDQKGDQNDYIKCK